VKSTGITVPSLNALLVTVSADAAEDTGSGGGKLSPHPARARTAIKINPRVRRTAPSWHAAGDPADAPPLTSVVIEPLDVTGR
jgi:hypothetical protein